ncbi:MAG: AgmX/PglI C-terminal domain-containing protein [Myxococcaceae bacterium]|nr:MAG: AgmX/PglI C-terminal domain-containing protein [Myxococcaceae bacterium]
MAPSHRTVLHWLVIPGASLGLLLLCALVASWLTRPGEVPEAPDAVASAKAPDTHPRAPEAPPREPPRATAPPTPSSPPPSLARAPAPRTGPDAPDPRRVALVEPQVESSTGRIDAEDLRLALQAVTPLVQQCFEDAAQRNPGTQEVKLRFTVEGENGDGKMNRGELLASSIPDPMVQACVLDSLLDARFPAPRLGGTATLVHPFRFGPPGEAGP